MLKKTILKKATSDNMKDFMEKVMANEENAVAPKVSKNTLKWGGWEFVFIGDTWEFKMPDNDEFFDGIYPSGTGHVVTKMRKILFE
jgi:hypothetical protein